MTQKGNAGIESHLCSACLRPPGCCDSAIDRVASKQHICFSLSEAEVQDPGARGLGVWGAASGSTDVCPLTMSLHSGRGAEAL